MSDQPTGPGQDPPASDGSSSREPGEPMVTGPQPTPVAQTLSDQDTVNVDDATRDTVAETDGTGDTTLATASPTEPLWTSPGSTTAMPTPPPAPATPTAPMNPYAAPTVSTPAPAPAPYPAYPPPLAGSQPTQTHSTQAYPGQPSPPYPGSPGPTAYPYGSTASTASPYGSTASTPSPYGATAPTSAPIPQPGYPPQAYAPAGYGQPTSGGYTSPPPAAAFAPAPQNTSAIVLTIISGLLTVSCYFTLAGLVPLIFGIIALSKQGSDMEGSKRMTRYGWIAMAVGGAVVVVGIIAFIGLIVASAPSDPYSY